MRSNFAGINALTRIAQKMGNAAARIGVGMSAGKKRVPEVGRECRMGMNLAGISGSKAHQNLILRVSTTSAGVRGESERSVEIP